MTLALPAAIPPPPPALAIREVRTAAEVAAYGEAAFLGFGYPVGAAGLFLNEHLLELPHVRLYAGVVDGAVVATSMLVATGSIAGIYWVATRAEQRGRGYGEALTWAAVAGGGESGCRVACLQASKAGFPVYARMGFAHVFDYEHLHPA
jgi:GNAT superfamily N-acetyltransferase